MGVNGNLTSKGKHWKLSNDTKEKLRKVRLGKINSIETRKKISETRKKLFKETKIISPFQINNPSYNKDIIEKNKLKWKEKYANGYINPMKGKKRPDLSEYNKLVKMNQTLDNNPNWRGGLSFGLYGVEFDDELKEKIRQRDNRECKICKIQEKDIDRKLSVHHIDYNKINNQECNLISLCTRCHLLTNFNREKWTLFFKEEKLKNYYKKYGKILLMIATRDRPTELALLLNSLRVQTYQKFDILIVDDAGGNPIQNYYFVPYTINRMKQEGHNVMLIRNDINKGVSGVRQQCVEELLKQKYKYLLSGRIDDDSICEPDYLENLVDTIDAGYDIASGVVPPFAHPEMKRDINFVEPIIGECKLNNRGELTYNGDDCGGLFTEHKILPSHHFRSCALFKREVFEAGVDYNSRLSKNGFREEQIISFKAIIKGFKIGCNTGAICWHLLTPSGGERDTMNLCQFNQQMTDMTIKRMYEEHGDFISKYNKELKITPKERTPTELLKTSNLIYNKKDVNLLDND